MQIENIIDSELSLDTPLITDFVKANLPSFMRQILVRLSEREQDVFIIGTLVAVSGSIEASGLYHHKKYHASLYAFISAPPASGKGVLNYCTQLILPLHKSLKKKSENEMEIYEAAKADYEQKKKAGTKNIEKPEKPLFRTLLIPANSSSSQFIEHLQHNGERGLIIETEADTLTRTLESDFGNYSDTLRKGFEHEPISMRRKTDKQYMEIFNPQLAVCLSGTPQQLAKLVTSVENGLFSRFIYYVFRNTPQWTDVTPAVNGEFLLPDMISMLSEDLSVNLMEQRRTPLNFSLQEHHWHSLNEEFQKRVKEFSCFVGEETSANIFRLAVSTFRMAMVLTTLRMIEANRYENNLVCNDLDFDMAMSLSETFYQHLLYAFKIVKNSDNVLDKQLKTFSAILPNSFDRKTAIEVARQNGITAHERTLDKYLKRLIDYKYLSKNEYNNYQKINSANGIINAA